jgi:soluble lytic murein transglycosylase-like protein
MIPESKLLVAVVAVTLALYPPHTAAPLPMAEVIVVSQKPLSLFNLSDQRDSLVVREARRQGVPEWLALSIAHAENWGGDSTAVNPFSGAVGLGQIHPVNFGRFPECGENIYNRQTNVCYMMRILVDCLSVNDTLADALACYGGGVSLKGRRGYNYDVARRARLEWIE